MPRPALPVAFWLEQIVGIAQRLEGHIAEMTIAEFSGDLKTIDATSWCISCIGEACGKVLAVDPSFERRIDGLELAAAYAARNRYVHGYFDLDVEQVWETASRAVPQLASAVRSALNEN